MSRVRWRVGPLMAIGMSAVGGAAYYCLQTSDASTESLNPRIFIPYTLVRKQDVSSTSAIFTLRNSNDATDSERVKETRKRSVWSIQIKQPQLQIARAYTPLPLLADEGKKDAEAPQDVKLLIRQEEGGEVSTYLHQLPKQSIIELRGPHTESELPHDVKEVIFLAGGTGIAPALQVAQVLSRKSGSVMHILWANRRREECVGGISDEGGNSPQTRIGWWKSVLRSNEDITQERSRTLDADRKKGLIVAELDALKERSKNTTRRLSVQYYVDEEKTLIQAEDVVRRMRQPQDGTGSRLILVAGPDGFVEYWAGKKLWIDGKEVQGPLGGQLGRMNLGQWKVVKL